MGSLSHIPLKSRGQNQESDSPFKKMGRSKRALQKNRAVAQDNSKTETKSIEDLTENKSIQSVPSIVEREKSDYPTFADMLVKIDKMRSSENLIPAVEVMMDMLEGKYNDLEKTEKMEIHNRMALVTYDLRWL